MGSKLKHKINPELVQIMSVEAADQRWSQKKVDPGFKFHSEISAPLLWDHFL